MYLKEDDITDINRIDEYNADYKRMYPGFKPFVTRENFADFLKSVEDKKNGIGNNGVKEIFYFAIEDDKIVGHASIRLNPEVDGDTYKFSGHIMYGVVPSKRKLGYGNKICKMLIEKMVAMGYDEIIITCNDNNIGSKKIIINNGGEFIESVNYNGNTIIDRYSINKKR